MVDMTEEIIFTGSNPTVDRQTRRLAASGKLGKIHSSIYTSNLTEPLESIGLRHALEIAGHLFPGAVLSGRTAKEMHASRALGQDGSRTGVRVSLSRKGAPFGRAPCGHSSRWPPVRISLTSHRGADG
jgi:hypothetical protein